jgi:hypothetical protein
MSFGIHGEERPVVQKRLEVNVELPSQDPTDNSHNNCDQKLEITVTCKAHSIPPFAKYYGDCFLDGLALSSILEREAKHNMSPLLQGSSEKDSSDLLAHSQQKLKHMNTHQNLHISGSSQPDSSNQKSQPRKVLKGSSEVSNSSS